MVDIVIMLNVYSDIRGDIFLDLEQDVLIILIVIKKRVTLDIG